MDFVVPVYLNQKLVFDLVAMSQNGIATVTKVSEASGHSQNADANAQASFGLNEAFSSLLKINLSANGSTATAEQASQSVTEERVHTPSSLFFSLRNTLAEKGAITIGLSDLPKPGTFVEFEASLTKNPLIEGLDTISKILEISNIFAEPAPQQKGRKGRPAGKSSETVMAEQLSGLSESLKAGGSRDLIAEDLGTSYKAVLTVEQQFLNDQTMSDLVDGHFRVFGKVVRRIEGSDQAINLLRKTPLAHTPEIIEQLLAAFEQLESDIFSMPTMETEIVGPAIQVLPIAIYA